jgi:hypothetical protein
MKMLTIVLGDRTYPVSTLKGVAAREWREKAIECLEVSKQGGGVFAFLHMPDMILGFVLEYANGIDREWVMQNATEEQIDLAFRRMFESTNTEADY